MNGTKGSAIQAGAERRRFLDPDEIHRLLDRYGIESVESIYETRWDKENVIDSANRLGYPVALKLYADGLSHKSDSGCVQLNLHSEKEVSTAYDNILERAGAIIDVGAINGFLIQEMEVFEHEVIVGLSEDPTFGKIILFGLGGIFVELLGDVSIRKVPIDALDARDMIEEIRGYAVLKGARGRQAADMEQLIRMLLAVSRVGNEVDEIVELDLNPVLVDGKRAIVADARVIVKGEDV